MKTINAYIYPTPEEFDRQIEKARSPNGPSDFDLAMLHAIFGACEAEAGMSLAERTVRDVFAEMLGLTPEALIVKQTPPQFIPNAPDEFVWRSHDGKRYNISDMATKHLFYSLRMIYNHTVAPVFRVLRPGETMKYYPDVPYWDADYRRRAVDAFVAELAERDDLDEDLARQYGDMQANTRVILALGL